MAFTFQINDNLNWIHDDELLKKAAENRPKINYTGVVPTNLVKIVSDQAYIGGYKSAPLTDKKEDIANYKLGRSDKIVLDLGDHQVGKFSVDVTSVGSPMDAPLYLHVKFAEIPAELATSSSDYDGWLSKSWIQEEFLHIDVLPTRLALPRRYSCRYIELEVIDSSPKWKAAFSSPLFISESCVDLPKQAYSGSDKVLEAIYDVSVKTLKDCMQDVFEDGPKRDRRLWLGDLRLQALANYATFEEMNVVKRCLYLFGAMTTEEGKIPANVFITPSPTPDDTFLFDYSLFFAVSLYDYIIASDDKLVLDDLYRIAKKQMAIAIDQVDKEGRLRLDDQYPVFVDWSNEFDKSVAGQAIFIYSLKRFIELAKMKEDVDLCYYQNILEKVIGFSKATLFDENRHQFLIEESGENNIASQVWMVLSEIMSPEENQQIMLEAIKNHFPIKDIATPYMYHHIVEALFVSGLTSEAVNLIKQYWGGMINLGADTFWEAFKPEDPDFSPYGSSIVNSYCHAWSCTPAYLLSKYTNYIKDI